MPDATNTSVGQSFIADNPSNRDFDLLDNEGNVISTVVGPSIGYFILTDNTTAGGQWIVNPWGGGFTAVTSVAAETGDDNSFDNLDIEGSPITSSGTFTFTFRGDLGALIDFGTEVGLAARTATDTWELRQIVGTNNQIQVTNPTGAGGNIQIGLVPAVQIVTSVQAGSMLLSGTTLSSITGSNLTIHPNAGNVIIDSPLQVNSGDAVRFMATNNTNFISLATGNINFNLGLTWPLAQPLAGQVLSAQTTGGQLQWINSATTSGVFAENELAKFANAGGTIIASVVQVDDEGNLTLAKSLSAGNIGSYIQIGVVDNQTISTQATNLVLDANTNNPGTGEVQCADTFAILAGNSLRVSTVNNANYGGFTSTRTNINNIWDLPTSDGTAGALVLSDGAYNLNFSSTVASRGITAATIPNAWVVFAGDTGAIIQDSNITSVTRTGVGTYEIVFATGFTIDSYGVNGGVSGALGIIGPLTITDAATCQVTTYNMTSTLTDFTTVYVQFFGPVNFNG